MLLGEVQFLFRLINYCMYYLQQKRQCLKKGRILNLFVSINLFILRESFVIFAGHSS